MNPNRMKVFFEYPPTFPPVGRVIEIWSLPTMSIVFREGVSQPIHYGMSGASREDVDWAHNKYFRIRKQR